MTDTEQLMKSMREAIERFDIEIDGYKKEIDAYRATLELIARDRPGMLSPGLMVLLAEETLDKYKK